MASYHCFASKFIFKMMSFVNKFFMSIKIQDSKVELQYWYNAYVIIYGTYDTYALCLPKIFSLLCRIICKVFFIRIQAMFCAVYFVSNCRLCTTIFLFDYFTKKFTQPNPFFIFDFFFPRGIQTLLNSSYTFFILLIVELNITNLCAFFFFRNKKLCYL